MFETNRTPLQPLVPYRPSVSDEQAMHEETLVRKAEKKARRRARLPLEVGALALAATTLVSSYWSDVKDTRAEQASAEISLNVMHKPLDSENSHKATIFIDGFNTYDADYISDKLGPGVQTFSDGEVWSLSYNNALLNREKIFTTIIEKAKKRDIDTISFAGYSMGGIIATEAATDVVTKTDINVDSITMLHTPDGDAGLQNYQKKELGLSQTIAEIVPGAIDSSWMRFGAEMYFNKGTYTQGLPKDWWNVAQDAKFVAENTDGFFNTVQYVSERLKDPKQTSTQLLSQQVYKIDQFDMKKELGQIAKQKDKKQMPVILYFGMDHDYMVKDDVSEANFREDSLDNGLDYYSYTVPHAVHSQFDKSIKEYMQTFDVASVEVSESVRAEAARHALYLYDQQDHDDDESFQAKK